MLPELYSIIRYNLDWLLGAMWIHHKWQKIVEERDKNISVNVRDLSSKIPYLTYRAKS